MFLLWINRRRIKEQAEFLSALKPVMLMGRGHSGTRVLSFACMHLGIQLGTSAATGDADDRTFTRTIKKIASRNLGSGAPHHVEEKDLIRFQNAVRKYYETIGSPQSLWGWKFPETYLIGDCIARTFPRARYIHLVRDGRDLAFKNHLTDDPNRTLGKKLLTHIGAMDLPHHLQAAMSWAFQVDRFDDFRQTLDADQILDMRFEDICREPMAAMQDVCRFLNIPMTQQCESFMTKQLDLGKIAQYKSEDHAKIREIEERISSTLKRYHYL
jgi:hypothetical protein